MRVLAIALYARKSVERENSISCETQIEYCRAMIRPDESEEEILEFIDNGFSGGNTDRDAFQKMMSLAKDGSLKKIIVYRLDRISRSLSDFVGILETLKMYGVGFFSSQESFDTSSSYGEMIVKILMVFAEFERQSIIERVTQAYAHRSEKGFYMGGRIPYGFTLKETELFGIKTKMLATVKTEAEQIKYIFESYGTGCVSLRHIVKSLNEKGMHPSKGSWSSSKLSTILRNPIYVRSDNAVFEYFSSQNANIISDISQFNGVHGLQLYGVTKHSACDMSDIKAVIMKHEGIIDSETWLRCRKKLNDNRQIGNSVSNGTSWLGGKIICRGCGRTMTVTKGSKHADGSFVRYFSCTGKSHNRICEGVKATVYAESLEEITDKLISERLSNLKGCKKNISAEASSKINLLKNRISEINSKQNRIVELILESKIENEMLNLFNEKAEKLSDEKRKAEEDIASLEKKECEAASPLFFSEYWKSASFTERKSVTNLLIQRIIISTGGDVEFIWNV